MKTRVLAALLALAPAPVLALDELNWAPKNHEVLARLIERHGRGSKDYDAARPPFAVFDWDQTSAFLDVEEALLHHQLWHFRFALSPEEWRGLFEDEIGGVAEVAHDGRKVRLVDLNADIVAHYAFLRGQKRPIEELRATPRFRDFIAKVAFLYGAYEETPGIGPLYAYDFLLYLLAGHTVPEVQALAKEAIDASLGDALRRETWRAPRDLETRAGPIDHTYRTGLRVHPEMQDLMASLRTAGIEVYVVSASLKEVVEVFGARYGYRVPADHVIAMELERDEAGRLRPIYKKDWVRTWREGKVEAIKRRFGKREPILVAGDSDGDVPMATAFEGTKVSLLLNRLKGGPIGELCARAAAGGERFLLQGRDENTGLFLPSSETIALGEKAARLLPAPSREAIAERLAAELAKDESWGKLPIKTDSRPGPLGTTIVRAFAQGAYPGAGVHAVLLHEGVTYGRRGEKDLAELVRRLEAPAADDLVKLVDAAHFDAAAMIDGSGKVTKGAEGLELRFVRRFMPRGGEVVVVTFPGSGPMQVRSEPLRD